MWLHKNMINNIDKPSIVFSANNNAPNVACYLQLWHNEKNIKFQNNILVMENKKDKCNPKDYLIVLDLPIHS